MFRQFSGEISKAEIDPLGKWDFQLRKYADGNHSIYDYSSLLASYMWTYGTGVKFYFSYWVKGVGEDSVRSLYVPITS